MTRTFLRRLVIALVAGGLVCAVALWVGMRPRPVLLVMAVVAVCAVGWLVRDLGADRYDLAVAAPRARLVPRWGLDPKFSRLAASLRPPHDPQVVANQVYATLLPIIDERLLAHHGIDRARDPERARAVMDPALAAYVDGPPRARRNLPGYLSDMVKRIEEL